MSKKCLSGCASGERWTSSRSGLSRRRAMKQGISRWSRACAVVVVGAARE